MNDAPSSDDAVAGEPRTLTPDESRTRGRRNIAIALGLVAFAALVFLLTLVRLKENVAAPGF